MKRREFAVKTTLSVIGATAVSKSWAYNLSSISKKENILVPLGMDAHSVRDMRWNAGQLIEYLGQIRS